MTDEMALKLITVLERIAAALERDTTSAGGSRSGCSSILDYMLEKDYGIIRYSPPGGGGIAPDSCR